MGIFLCTLVSGFGQVLKSDPREKLVSFRPLAEHVSAWGDKTKLPVAREKKPLVPRVLFLPLVALIQ